MNEEELIKQGRIIPEHAKLFKFIAAYIYKDWETHMFEYGITSYPLPIVIEFNHGNSDDLHALKRYYNDLNQKPTKGIPEKKDMIGVAIDFGNPRETSSDASRLSLNAASFVHYEELYKVSQRLFQEIVPNLGAMRFTGPVNYILMINPVVYEMNFRDIYTFIMKPKGKTQPDTVTNITSWRRIFCSPSVLDSIRDLINPEEFMIEEYDVIDTPKIFVLCRKSIE